LGKVVDIVNIIRCHNRAGSLENAVRQSQDDIPNMTGLSVNTILVVDRPTEEVASIVEYLKEIYNGGLATIYDDDKFDEKGTTLTGKKLLNMGLDFMDEMEIEPTWIWQQDDDEVLGLGYEQTLADLVRNHGKILAYEAMSLFVWDYADDGEALINLNQFHFSPVFMRYKKGMRYSLLNGTDNITDIQKRILRNPYRRAPLPFYLMDTGADTEEKREAIRRERREAGSDDRFIRAFSEEAKLVPVSRIIKEYPVPNDFMLHQIHAVGRA